MPDGAPGERKTAQAVLAIERFPMRERPRRTTSAPSWHAGIAPIAVPGVSSEFLVSPQSPLLPCRGRIVEQGPFPPAAFAAFLGTMDPSDSSPGPLASACGLVRSVAVASRTGRGLPCSARSCCGVPPLLPRESTAVHWSSTFPLHAAFADSPSGSASPLIDEATSGFAVRCGPSLRSRGLQPTAFRPRFCWTPRGVTQGTWLPVLSTSDRVSSFHLTRNAPLHGAQGESSAEREADA